MDRRRPDHHKNLKSEERQRKKRGSKPFERLSPETGRKSSVSDQKASALVAAIQRDDLITVTIKDARVFDFFTIESDSAPERLLVLKYGGRQVFLVVTADNVTIEPAPQHLAVSSWECSCGWAVDGFVPPELARRDLDSHITGQQVQS